MFGQEKTNKHKHFGRDGVRDKHEPSLGQTGPLPGTNWDPSLGQTGLFLFNSTVKSPFCPVCPWDGWGFVPGTIVPQGPSEKCLCVFCLLVFFAPRSGPHPQYGWGFPEEIRKNSGKTPEKLSERFLEFPSRVRLGCPKPHNSRHLRLPEQFQNSLPPSTAGDATLFSEKWFRRGPLKAGHGIPSSTEGVSEQGKPTKKARIFRLFRTPQLLGKEGKDTQKKQGVPRKATSARKSNISKEKKIKVASFGKRTQRTLPY